MKIELNINGKERKVDIEGRKLLIDVLRDELELTASHIGCDTSNCGACTVLLDDRPVKSCTVLAAEAQGHVVTTLEGLSSNREMKVLKKSFLDNHGLQCGFCTSGMLISSYTLLRKNRKMTEAEMREAISGNLCRCTGYQGIIRSIEEASRELEKQKEEQPVKIGQVRD